MRLRRMRVAAAAAIGLAVVVTTGVLTEAAAERREAKEVPRIGRAVDIGGRTLNIYCSGTGSPTVVFESNWGAPGFRWRYVQRAVAGFTRACSYDRAVWGGATQAHFPTIAMPLPVTCTRFLRTPASTDRMCWSRMGWARFMRESSAVSIPGMWRASFSWIR